jgi:hypothetical protein
VVIKTPKYKVFFGGVVAKAKLKLPLRVTYGSHMKV